MHPTKPNEMTWKMLHHANRGSMITPFNVTLGEHDSPLVCEQIIRIMPGKRLVAFATWNDQLVVAKLFYGERAARRHYEQELTGIESLLSSGVPTPRLLFHGTAYKKRVYVLIFEQILEARNLEELWQEKVSVEEQVPLMHAVTIELATQHVLGIVQTDLHLKNFLLKGNQIYTLDGGSIECFHEPLARKASLDHLALFFSQLGAGTEKLRQALFYVYTRARGWIVKPVDLDYLNTAVKKCNQQRWENYQEKIMRNCTAFEKMNNTSTSIMYARDYQSETFLKLLANPDVAFTQPNSKILKAGRSSTVARITLDNRMLVVKRYNVKDTWHWLRRSLRASRAAESWRLANLLRLFFIPTPKPVAFIEKKFLGLRNKSYFIMEYIDGMHLGDYFANYHESDAHFEKIAVRVIVLLNNLTKLKVSHGDLKMTNILLQHERPVLIDLDGMQEYKSQAIANRAYKKEIKRFMKNWLNKPRIKILFERLLKDYEEKNPL
jgi:tRNA A-37 threonylcarbamoyl transferase component Bud32